MNELDTVYENGNEDGLQDCIEVDGEVFHIEEFEPTEEEYKTLIGGLYKSFYDADIKAAVDRATMEKQEELLKNMDFEIQKREDEIRREAAKEILNRISKRRMRPDENGISVQHAAKRRDVSKMTKEERAEAARKAAGGLIINLK